MEKGGAQGRPNRSHATALATAGVLAVALALRLWGLGRESLWLDEATSLMLARMPIPALLAWTAADIHPPLYYLLLHFWRHLGEGEATLRGLSVLGGMLGVGLTFLVARRLFGRRTALAAALLVAVAPLHIWYSQEARGYVWLATFGLLAMYGLATGIADPSPCPPGFPSRPGRPAAGLPTGCRRPRRVPWGPRGVAPLPRAVSDRIRASAGEGKRPSPAPGESCSGPAPGRGWGGVQKAASSKAASWLAYVLGMALALYVHYYAVFLLLAANVLVVALVLIRQRPARFLVPWAVAQAAVGALYLPWLPVFLRTLPGGARGWVAEAGPPGLGALEATAVSFMVGGAQRWLPVWLRRASYLAFVAALGLGVIRGTWLWADERARRRRVGILLAGGCFALPVATAWLISQVRPLFSGRYLLPFLPPFLIVAGRGTMALPRWRWRLLALALVLVGPLWATAEQVRHLENPDWRGLAEEIAAAAQPGDVIILMPGWNAKPLDYYLRGRVAIGEYVPEPMDAAQAEEARQTVQRTIAPYRRAWLLWAKGHYTDPNGIVAAYLDGRARRLESRSVPGVGELILYDLAAGGG